MPGPHLSDDQLSALLDGDEDAAGPASGEHVRDCPACAARLDRFRAVASAIAAPVAPLPAETVDALVAGALAPGSSRRGAIPSIGAARARRNRWVPSTAALATVAAVLVLLLGLPLVLGGLGDAGDRDSEAAMETTGDDTATASGRSAAGGAGPEPLAAGTTAAMGSDTAAGTASGAPAVLGAIATEDDLVGRLIAAMSTTRGDADTAGGEEPAAGGPAAPPVAFSCADQASSVGGTRLGGSIYAASLTWRDIDAEVHVFLLTEPVDGLTRQAYVMARADCRVLAEPRF